MPGVAIGCGLFTTALRKRPLDGAANTNVTSYRPPQAPTEG